MFDIVCLVVIITLNLRISYFILLVTVSGANLVTKAENDCWDLKWQCSCNCHLC